jgi:hypothetical protein
MGQPRENIGIAGFQAGFRGYGVENPTASRALDLLQRIADAVSPMNLLNKEACSRTTLEACHYSAPLPFSPYVALILTRVFSMTHAGAEHQ